MAETKTHIKESTHWYAKDGTPAYTIKDKKGNDRATTLRDARKLNLYPSVTMIIREAAKPGLENWKQDQMMMAALTLPRIPDESETDFIARIKEDAKQQAIKAAERGTQIHTWIQQGFEGLLSDSEGEIFYEIAKKVVEKECGKQEWICEQSFVSNDVGGKVDLHCPICILDIKTKDTTLNNIKTWDEHDMQIACYRRGLRLHKAAGGILFISTTELEGKIVWIEEDKLQRGLIMFDALKNYWYAKVGLINA
jgi:hypothetical protein